MAILGGFLVAPDLVDGCRGLGFFEGERCFTTSADWGWRRLRLAEECRGVIYADVVWLRSRWECVDRTGAHGVLVPARIPYGSMCNHPGLEAPPNLRGTKSSSASFVVFRSTGDLPW